MAVAHVALDLRPGGQRRHGVHHHHVDGAGAHQCFADLKALLSGIRLGDEHGVDVHAQRTGIGGVKGVLGVDEGHLTAPLLGLGHDVQGQCGLAGGFRAVDLDDAPLGHAADAQRDVQRQRAGGDGLHHDMGVFAQPHDGALAKVLFDLGDRRFQRFFLIRSGRRGFYRLFLVCHASSVLSDSAGAFRFPHAQSLIQQVQ